MKHARDATLDGLDGLLQKIRSIPGLKERKLGIFYFKSSAFLHFHEDPVGLFADLRQRRDWKRYRISSRAERAKLVKAATAAARTLPNNARS